jgi:hypothetical protein
MPKHHRLVVDALSEVAPMLKPWTDESFYEFATVEPVAGSTYIIGRQQFIDNPAKVRDMCQNSDYVMIFNNSAEGSWTMETQLLQLKIDQLVRDGRMLVISGADITADHVCLTHEHLLIKIMDFDQTLQAQTWTDDIFNQKQKPYTFLFLNGRARPHRKYLYERMKRKGLLDRSLYTMLDAKPTVVRRFVFRENGIDVMATPSPLQRLPDEYEVERYRNPEFGPIVPDRTFLKQELFRREWGEIYLYHRPYVDTYFSLVTETVCAESDISFRTEKIAKPLAMGHPFIVAANRGFYRDLRNLGFRTFSSVIDESFDLIDDSQARMDRLIAVVQDICSGDLGSFLDQSRSICKYNQQHLAEFTQEHRQAFPSRFFQFVSEHARS